MSLLLAVILAGFVLLFMIAITTDKQKAWRDKFNDKD